MLTASLLSLIQRFLCGMMMQRAADPAHNVFWHLISFSLSFRSFSLSRSLGRWVRATLEILRIRSFEWGGVESGRNDALYSRAAFIDRLRRREKIVGLTILSVPLFVEKPFADCVEMGVANTLANEKDPVRFDWFWFLIVRCCWLRRGRTSFLLLNRCFSCEATNHIMTDVLVPQAMMTTTEPLLLRSEVKKEESELHHHHHHMCGMEDCSPADSSLYSPTTTGLQLEVIYIHCSLSNSSFHVLPRKSIVG